MNKFLITAATVASICVTACAQKEEKTDMNTQQTLVAYFSATGTTARVAREIADVTGRRPPQNRASNALHERRP